MALGLTLVVLLVVGGLIPVSMLVVENLMSTTDARRDDGLRMNAALSGVERGKEWLLREVRAGRVPSLTGTEPLGPLSPDFSELLVDVPQTFDAGDASVTVSIYDLTYGDSEDIVYAQGIPPRIYIAAFEGEDLRAGSPYSDTNVSGGNPGAGVPGEGRIRTYLVRSRASLGGVSKQVEQAILIRP